MYKIYSITIQGFSSVARDNEFGLYSDMVSETVTSREIKGQPLSSYLVCAYSGHNTAPIQYDFSMSPYYAKQLTGLFSETSTGLTVMVTVIYDLVPYTQEYSIIDGLTKLNQV
tara:strand:- start:1144 stop:1482 length:339 start_codon:yes stop_codon:yes gene_type:complete